MANMIFLSPLENWSEELFSGTINHYPLIQLIIFSLDKSILYIIALIIGQLLYVYSQSKIGKTINWSYQIVITLFSCYLIMLVHLTVLRYDWQWWQNDLNWQRPLTEINLRPLTDTVKLLNGESIFSYWYNFFGNVIWFVPFGLFVPYLLKRRHSFFHTLGLGLSMSIIIELSQFWYQTGVTHIDDVLFNAMGAIIGYVGYDMFKIIKPHSKTIKKEKHA